MKALAAAWRARTPSERTVLAVLVAVAAILLYVVAFGAIDARRQKLGERVNALSAQAAALERHAAEIERLRGIARAAPAGGDLRAAIETEARARGVARSVTHLDNKSANEVEAALPSVAFGDWLAWVAALQRQNVRVATCRIEALSTPGVVNVTATFVRGR
ncbi:MAG TPA: type II secretion system protein GspM [Burkholderiales bacterium]|nr:type II secretion system protein GspM [Burkholderiales bacterium]